MVSAAEHNNSASWTHQGPLNSLELWQGLRRQVPVPPLKRERVPAELSLRSALTSLQGETIALALEFPFSQLPACYHPSQPSSQQAVRHYLDNLFTEMKLVPDQLSQPLNVSHLFWLGDPVAWLSKAELTEVMYRTSRFFKVGGANLSYAVVDMVKPRVEEGLYALLRGLGFTHLLLNDDWQQTAESQETHVLQQYWSHLGLQTITTEQFRCHGLLPASANDTVTTPTDNEPAPNVMLGLGADAWSLIGQHVTHNAPQLDLYYQRLAENRLPVCETGIGQEK